jgi:hypothetical protein
VHVTDVAARIVALRDERLGEGISLEQQYSLLRDPGRNALRDLEDELDRAAADAYGFEPAEDPLAQPWALNESIALQERSGLTESRGPWNAGLSRTMLPTSRIEAPLLA